MRLKKEQTDNLILFSTILFLFFSLPILQAQNCNSGELGWTEMLNIYTEGGCTDCHGRSGGFNLTSYASFMEGGSKCGSDITQNNVFLDIITINNYSGCSTSIRGMAMNNRVANAIDSLDLYKIQRWINAGIPELCDNFCIEDEVITIALTNAIYHFEVNNILSANNEVSNSSNIIYEAGENINLDIGFSVDAVSDFHAFIGACD